MKWLKWLTLLPLFLWGLFYHISASEFWPITISKTWFQWSHFESSVLQKPLLTLFLSLFHLLPLSDVAHLWAVKTVFVALGCVSLGLYSHFVTQNTRDFFLVLLLLFLSPFVSLDFFRIRSDQLAFLFFTIFLILSDRKRLWPSLFFLLLLPVAGIKEIFFLVPGAIIFYTTFKGRLNKKYLFFSLASGFAVLIWILALNTGAFSYFLSTRENANFPSPELKLFLTRGSLMLAASIAAILYIFLKKKSHLYVYAVTALHFIIFLFVMPQTYSFYIAALSPFIFLPALLLLFSGSFPLKFRTASVAILMTYSLASFFFGPVSYDSNRPQFEFISTASDLVGRQSFTYLDGEGILPRQKFIQCFASPYDEISNSNCLQRLESSEADVIITTNRLAFLGPRIFSLTERNYEQIRPNLWVKKEKAPKLMSIKDLSPGQPIPILIF